jgi:hypothetical protein
MSYCTTASCVAHRKDVFIRLDLGTPYPWVHTGGMAPCDAVPPATAAEAGEVCACGHPSDAHRAPTGPIPFGALAHRAACGKCRCPDFAHSWQRAA